jgi:hypothetical protein
MLGNPPEASLSGTPHPSAPGKKSPERVAVIAIHGVGHHLSGASAEDLAALLESVGREDYPPELATKQDRPKPYLGFRSKSLEIPLRAVYTQDLADEHRDRVKAQRTITRETTQPPGSKSVASAVDPKSPPEDDPTPANERYQSSWWSRIVGVFDERRGFLAAVRQRKHGDVNDPANAHALAVRDGGSHSKFDYQYMLTQLAGYRGSPGRKFSTIRLESEREPGSPKPQVHIYDAHYSDLSKQQNSIVSFFFAFYQLLFHLGGLSLLAVYWAEAENTEDSGHRWRLRWRLLSTIHAVSVRLLIMFIPLLNLSLLAIGISAFADKLDGLAAMISGGTLSALLGLAFVVWWQREAGSPRRPVLWAAIPFIGICGGIALFTTLASLDRWCPPAPRFHTRVVVLTWLVLAGIGVGLIGYQFSKMRPGACLVACATYFGNVGFFLWYFFRFSHSNSGFAAPAVFVTTRLLFGEMALCWLLCLFSAMGFWLLGLFCKATTVDEDRKCRARSALRTGRLAFAIPASLFLVVTLALWSGIVSYGSHKLHIFETVSDLTQQPEWFGSKYVSWLIPDVKEVDVWVNRVNGPESSAQGAPPALCGTCTGVKPEPEKVSCPWDNYLTGLLLMSMTPGIPITLVLLGFSFLLLVCTVAPSVLYEISPLSAQESTNAKARAAGDWLSRGLDNTAVLVRLAWFAIVPVQLAFGILHLLSWHNVLPQDSSICNFVVFMSESTLPLIKGTGTIVVISAAAVAAGLLKYGSTILDTILDVDNYLRISPKEETPRACIAERCTSLLRYIAAPLHDRGYDRLIIVGHSLGSLVTADLLRFLKTSYHPRKNGKRPHACDPTLNAYGFNGSEPSIPIYFLSMGNPLRQLLNRFFPHLYAWVARQPDNSSPVTELTDAGDTPMAQIPAGSLPNPRSMCVKGWLNAYRSGDYVGRFLWLGPWLARNQDANCGGDVFVGKGGDGGPATRAEMCIGIGAHTHYWDRTAPDIAAVLETLIEDPAQMF